MIDRIMPLLKDVHVVILINLQSKRDFAGVIKLRVLMWGRALGYLGGPSVIRVFTREAGWSE